MQGATRGTISGTDQNLKLSAWLLWESPPVFCRDRTLRLLFKDASLSSLRANLLSQSVVIGIHIVR